MSKFNKQIISLTSSLDYAVYPLKYIVHSPAKYVKLPSRRAVPEIPTRKKQKAILLYEDFQKIIDRFPKGHPFHLPFQIAYRTGLRLGEVFGLTWDDIDLNNSIINLTKQIQYINKKLTFTLPKYDSTRIIAFDSELKNLFTKTKLQHDAYKIAYGIDYKNYYIDN